MSLLYLDSSALVKLVLPEAETEPLRAFLGNWSDYVSSEIADVEVVRAAHRASHDRAVHRRAREVMGGVHLLRLDEQVLARAAELGPRSLRTLDALHLSSALQFGEDLGGFVAYDARLRDAASAAGLDTPTPGLGASPGGPQ